MKKADMKKIVQRALKNQYGFAPTLSDITILEDGGNAQRVYIAFGVGEEQYLFNSYYYLGKENGVWVGKGTIEHV